MAKDKGPEGAEAAPTGGAPKLLYVLVAVNLVLTLGLGGALALQLMGGDDETAPAAVIDAAEESVALPSAGATYAFDPFVVNLMDSVNIRYIKVEMEVELSDEGVAREIDEHESQMRDMVISILSNRTYGELLGVSGKIQLREELLRRMNQALTSGTVTRIYFTEFVVQ